MERTVDDALSEAGAGRFQRRLMAIFGLVWAADAMQVVAVGFAAPSIAKHFGVEMKVALQTGTLFFLGMFVGAFLFGRLADRIGRRNVLIVTVACDAVFGIASMLAPTFGWLLALRFLTGTAVADFLSLPISSASAATSCVLVMGLAGAFAMGTCLLVCRALDRGRIRASRAGNALATAGFTLHFKPF